MTQQTRPSVVIIGAGFAGINAARALKKARVDITIIDRQNHHLFQPLLYQVATASLSPADIAQPVRAIFRNQDNVKLVLMADVTAIDTETRQVQAGKSTISYDYLIVATGSQDAYFGHDEWAAVAPGLKSIDDAVGIRRRILVAFEMAEQETDEEVRQKLLTFVVVGGGPTGAELAGALGEISRQTLAREFDQIDPTWAHIYLFEAGQRILQTFPEDLSRTATRYLNSLGVQVRTGQPVEEVTADGVVVGGKFVPAATVLWAAGVKASPVGAMLGVPTDRAGRVLVNPDLTVPGLPNVFVAGDLASLQGPDGKPLPGVAQVAIQGGTQAAKNIRHAIDGEPLEPFHYHDKGNLATIGRNRAVADIRGRHLTGFLAWSAWLWIHIYFLIGFRNRLTVMLQWAWSYLTFNRGARLITRSDISAQSEQKT
ncbi:MAG: NAD(P)/FAD-dependent oxidoreductase [Thermomicrobiales bacterium]|nr:NAD(P)/FAD-dependent oxidoreductase [Thermomicrobiales bacterium]